MAPGAFRIRLNDAFAGVAPTIGKCPRRETLPACPSGRLPARFAAPLAAAVLLLGGCHPEHAQSMLHPDSAAAAEIAWLWWFLFIVCGIVFLIVMALTAFAIFSGRYYTAADAGEPGMPSPVGNGFIVIGGAVIPAVILVMILFASVKSQIALRQPQPDLTIRVVGHQWWWEIHYPDQQIRTANEIHIPVGDVVRLEMRAADVIHSLWIPNLQGKTDLLPDKVTSMWLQADRPGIWRGQCAEYCGGPHALMGLRLVALQRDEFDGWVAERQQAAAATEPQTDVTRRGFQVFFDAKCDNCHAIAGSRAIGLRGPDLTHIGSRLTLGAGLLHNNQGNLGGWIANPQALKPGNLMPATYLEPDELHALVEYLQSLR